MSLTTLFLASSRTFFVTDLTVNMNVPDTSSRKAATLLHYKYLSISPKDGIIA